jgi:CheY-like chemotaxis protein
VLDRSRNQGDDNRILVVEDEPLVRMLLAQTLTELGCKVEEAGSSREALEKFADIGGALSGAIVDLGLPDQPGDAVIRQIRITRPRLPVVLATGYADNSLRQHWSRDSLVEILAKPYQPDDVKAALKRLGIRVR